METQTVNRASSVANRLSDTLKKTQQEIEELVVQLALGKAHAADKFEEAKKEMNVRLNELKNEWSELQSLVSNEKLNLLKAKMDELQVQLALGKAEAKDLFEEQKKKIFYALGAVETELKSNPELKPYVILLRSDIEKFKLKLEIFKLKFELNKFEIKDAFKENMNEARIELDKRFAKFEEKWDHAKEKYDDFSDEMELSFKHLKKAVLTL